MVLEVEDSLVVLEVEDSLVVLDDEDSVGVVSSAFEVEVLVEEEIPEVFVDSVEVPSGNFVVCAPHFTRSALSHFIFSALYNM